MQNFADGSNIGVSARNKGWQAASGRCLMLDDDIEISAGIINAIKVRFKTSDAGITAFRVVNVEGDEESCLLPVVFTDVLALFAGRLWKNAGAILRVSGFMLKNTT